MTDLSASFSQVRAVNRVLTAITEYSAIGYVRMRPPQKRDKITASSLVEVSILFVNLNTVLLTAKIARLLPLGYRHMLKINANSCWTRLAGNWWITKPAPCECTFRLARNCELYLYHKYLVTARKKFCTKAKFPEFIKLNYTLCIREIVYVCILLCNF